MMDFRVLLLDEQGNFRAASDRAVDYQESGRLARWIEHGGHRSLVVPNGKRFDSPTLIKFYAPNFCTIPMPCSVAGAPAADDRDPITFAHWSHEAEYAVPAPREQGNKPQEETSQTKRTWWQWAWQSLVWVIGAWSLVIHSAAGVRDADQCFR